MTEEAIGHFISVVESAGTIATSRSNRRGQTLLFTKRVNGTIFVVEQVRTAQGRLVFFDLWIKEAE